VGIDVSPKVIEAAARRVLGSGGDSLVAQRVRFEVGDMHALPLGDASVDVALLLHVLGYSTEPVVALREAARVLRPGGRVVVATLARAPARRADGPLWPRQRGLTAQRAPPPAEACWHDATILRDHVARAPCAPFSSPDRDRDKVSHTP
jgi:ubiquinone/menaquinone biosynthesis C-methylase UbiE